MMRPPDAARTRRVTMRQRRVRALIAARTALMSRKITTLKTHRTI